MKTGASSAWKIALALMLSFLFLGVSAYANAGINYTIREGDTLSGIAYRYNVSVRAIRRINRVSPRRLRPGSKIMIPVRNKSARRKSGEVEGNTEIVSNDLIHSGDYSNDSLKSVRQTALEIYHNVRKGETLSSIARDYSVTVAEIRELNGLRTSRLKRGSRLLIRVSSPATYVVRRGDSLSKIAERFNVNPGDLMKINGLKRPAVKVGQKLCIREEAGETAEEAADVTSAGESDAVITEGKTEKSSGSASGPEEEAARSVQGRLVAFARKMLNIPYKFGGNSILGIDCSAYVRKVYGFLGIDLPRTAREQFHSGTPIDKEQLSVGDLVFFGTHASFPTHVGIYIGNDLFIHASSKDRKVTISNLDTPYFLRRFLGAKRILTNGIMERLSSDMTEETQ